MINATPHLKLAKMGSSIWNRWARTLMNDEKIDSLEISSLKKKMFKTFLPFNDEEKKEIAKKIGLTDLDKLDRYANFKDIEIECDFLYFWFPGGANFRKVTFSKYASFREATFSGDTNFSEATFSEDASFIKATFSDFVYFNKATFSKVANFSEVTFSGDTNFSEATFSKVASFRKATFSEDADFREVTFSGGADFNIATFSDFVYFNIATFSKTTNFIDATFSKVADFREATFSGGADFRKATFSETVNFREATFSGVAYFNKATFSWNADFREATFSEDTNFSEATFGEDAPFRGVAYFINSSFESTTLFIKTIFYNPPEFHNVDFHQNTSFHEAEYRKITGSENDARSWRTLKLEMNKSHNHDQEMKYYKYEMDAKKVVFWLQNKYASWLLISIYKLFSSYGASLLRPSIWLILSWILFTILYSYVISGDCTLSFLQSVQNNCFKEIQLSAANVLPFLYSSKMIMSSLFEGKSMGLFIQTLSIIQGIFSTLMLFLMGLALKNKFSIK